jgi:hypothetical protein
MRRCLTLRPDRALRYKATLRFLVSSIGVKRSTRHGSIKSDPDRIAFHYEMKTSPRSPVGMALRNSPRVYRRRKSPVIRCPRLHRTSLRSSPGRYWKIKPLYARIPRDTGNRCTALCSPRRATRTVHLLTSSDFRAVSLSVGGGYCRLRQYRTLARTTVLSRSCDQTGKRNCQAAASVWPKYHSP